MNVVVAVSGGVAALKAPSLLRRLREAGHEVRAAATADAYHFITPLSLAIAAGSEVFDRDAWFRPDGETRHLQLANWADVLVIAPATADALASAATGRADDVISALAISGVERVVWVPAMNTAMWTHPAVQANVEQLKRFGHAFIGPVYGALAAKDEGEGAGRMAEPEDIVSKLPYIFSAKDYAGRQVLVSAGPTREYLDPVRFISNPSSGKMGYAVAEAAALRGAQVTLVSGPSHLPVPEGVTARHVESAEAMLTALQEHFADAALLVMTAAVADWRASDIAREKKPKSGETMRLELRRTPDILQTLSERRQKQVMVGFAMETDQGVERAADKARRKGLDFICLNYPRDEASAFGGDQNKVTFVKPDGESEPLPLMPKRDIADELLDRALPLLKANPH